MACVYTRNSTHFSARFMPRRRDRHVLVELTRLPWWVSLVFATDRSAPPLGQPRLRSHCAPARMRRNAGRRY